MLRHLAGLFLMFASITASASLTADRWIEVRSPHFTVLTNSNEKNARHIASQLEQMRSVFHTIFPTSADDNDAPITVFSLKDKKSFQTLEPAAYLAKGQLDIAGLFLRSQEKNYILLRLDAQGEHPFAIVYHEYTHYMLRKSDAWLPLWLNEGLAEFYQNTDIEGKDVRLGQPSAADIYFLRDNRLLPVTTLLQVDRSSPYYHEEQKGTIFYAESWALTHYLVLSDSENKTHRLQEYAHLLVEGQGSVSAAQTAFGDLKKLDRALNDYVQQSNFKLYKINYVSSTDESSFHTEPVSSIDVDAVRADVLLNADRTQDAQTLLAQVLQQDPKNAMAHEAMGLLEFRAGNFSSAKKWFDEAVQLNSTSYLAHYYYAVLSLRTGDQIEDAAVESSLRTAIKLNPNFAPSYDALAMFYAARHEKLDEAYMLELSAVTLEPENLNYRMNAASVLTDNQKFSSALAVLNVAAHMAKSTYDTVAVQNRIQQVEDYQAAIERRQKQDSEMVTHTTVLARVNGNAIHTTEPELTTGPKYPTEPPTGTRHTVHGILRSVQCYYPSVMTLSVQQSGKTVSLYSNNYFHIDFSAANFTPENKMNPCTTIEGMKARVEYAEVSDKSIAGQILSIELSK
jgi:Flp pilus assembly protein TadD